MDDERFWERLGRARVTRRGFLAGAAATPLAAVLAACSKTVEQPTRPEEASPLPTELEDSLVIYNWADYINPKTISQFEQEFDVTITQDFYASNEEARAKLAAGAKGYDIVVPTGYMVEILAKKGFLYELDASKIPNLSLVDDQFKNTPFDPESKYAVPKDFGTTGFGYRSDMVKEAMTSWEDFFRLASKYSGRYTVLDVPVDVIGAGLKLLGYSWNSTDPKEVDEATNELIKIKPHILTITSVYRELVSKGEAWVAMGWNGDFLSIQGKVPAVSYVVPTEGTEIWTDNWSILADAPHPLAAHTFLNWVLQPEIQAQETRYTYYGSPVGAASQFLPPEIVDNPAVYPAPEVFEKLEFTSSDPVYTRLVADAWTKFKAA